MDFSFTQSFIYVYVKQQVRLYLLATAGHLHFLLLPIDSPNIFLEAYRKMATPIDIPILPKAGLQ